MTDPGFWDDASKKAAEKAKAQKALAADPEGRARSRRSKRRKIILGVVGGVALILLLAVVFLPQIAGAIAPGIIASKSDDAIPGSATVQRVRLSWGGPQRVETLKVLDTKGKEILSASVEVDRGLIALATATMDLGTVKVSGLKADIVRNADGTTNVQQALVKAQSGSGSPKTKSKSNEPISLPAGLNVALDMKNADVTYTDLGTPANPADRARITSGAPGSAAAGFAPLKVAVTDLDASAQLAAGKPLLANVQAQAQQVNEGGANPAGAKPGSIVVDIRLEPGWYKSDGRVDLDAAEGKATITATSVPTALLDAILGPVIAGTTLQESLGRDVQASVVASGSMENATATISLNTEGVKVSGEVGIASGLVTVKTPMVAEVTSGAMTRLLPDVMSQLRENPNARLEALPGVKATVNALSMKIQPGLDLRGGRADVTVRAEAMRGQVALQPGEAFQSLATEPLEVRVSSDDFAQGVRVTGATSATVGGKPAGTLSIDATARGLLDATGKPVAGLPRSLQGQVALRGMTTALAQPFAGTMVDLTRDIGPTLDLNIIATTSGEAGSANATAGAAPGAGAIPPTDLDIAASSQFFNLAAALRLEPTAIRSRGEEPVRVQMSRAGAIAAGFVPAETGWAVDATDGMGSLALEARNLNIQRVASTGALDLPNSAASVTVNVGNMRATAAHAGDAPVEIGRAMMQATLEPGRTPTVQASVNASHMGKPFRITANQTLTGIFTRGSDGVITMTPARMKPEGLIEIIEAPTTLARLMPPPAPAEPAPVDAEPKATTRGDAADAALRITADAPVVATLGAKPSAAPIGRDQPRPTQPDAAPAPPAANVGNAGNAPDAPVATASLDLPALIQSVLGPQVSARVTTAPVEGQPDAFSAVAVVNATNVAVNVKAAASETSLRLNEATAQVNIAPETLRTLLNSFAPGVTGVPRLNGPATVYAAIDPVTLPTSGLGKVQVDQVGPVKATVAIPGRTLVDGLQVGVAQADGTVRTLSAIGIEDFRLVANVPVAAMVAEALPDQRATSVDLRAQLLGAGGARVGSLTGTLNADISNGQPAGGLNARFEISEIDVKGVEGLLLPGDALSQALGERANVSLVASLSPPENARVGDKFAPMEGTIDVEAGIQATRLRSDGPIKARVKGGMAALTAPTRFSLSVPPDLANTYIAPPPANGQRDPNQLRLVEPAEVQLSIETFRMPLGAVGDPGVVASADRRLEAAVSVRVARAALASQGGNALALNGVEASVRTPGREQPVTAPIPFSLSVAQTDLSNVEPITNMRITGIVEGLVDAQGNLVPDNATMNASGALPAFPTALIDTLAKQNGLLTDLLGPVVVVERLEVNRVPLTKAGELTQRGSNARATIDVAMRTERAAGSVSGVLGDAIFVAQQPVQFGINEVTEALAGRFMKGMPFLGKVTKNKEDAPAMFKATGLTVPLSNDWSRLNGQVVLDPGEARFAASDDFAGLLSNLAMRQQGTVGQRLQPLNVSIVNGVATYEKWAIPLGEFSVETTGTVDMVQRRIDVVTWIPFGQLSSDAARLFGAAGNLGGGALLQAADRVPFRTSGSLDNPSTRPDMELFAKTFVEKLSPEELIKDRLKDLIPKPSPRAPR